MIVTLVISDSVRSQLRDMAGLEVESAGVLLAKVLPTEDGGQRLLINNLRIVPESAYTHRSAKALEISSHGYVPALAEAAAREYTPLWFHTHIASDSSPRPSARDKKVDSLLSDLFRLRTNSEYYGSLVFSIDPYGDLSFTGHLDNGTAQIPINRCLTVGPRISLELNYAETPQTPLELFSRNIRAFGGRVQSVLGDFQFTIVGCGGTGSAVAEQLVRLGARNILLVDGDVLSESNTTRVYGSHVKDIGRPKVDVLADHLRSIAPNVSVNSCQGMITGQGVAKRLVGSDIIFACTDDNAGRLVLSRMSTYLMIPVIDCGVILTSDNEKRLEGINGRVTIMYPGAACLVCRNRIDLQRASSEMLTPKERKRRVDEGYAPALGDIEPAVITYTTAVAATAVSELLERLIGYGPEPVPNEVILRLHEREVSTNISMPHSHHYCDPASEKIGIGLTTPFLEQTWQT